MNCLRVLNNWRRWIRFVVIIIYVLILVIALPLCIWQLERKGASDHVEAWFVGGLFVMMALPISFMGILQHVINYTCPHLQRHIIRILWMVPIYALNAWFALRFPPAAIYLDTLRECYEAYVIYNFMAYLLSYLHHDYPHLDVQIENKPPVSHVFPLCLLPPCQNGIRFVRRCKHGVLQYTIVRPLMTLLAVFCEMFDVYGEGDFSLTTGWTYIVIINNMSQVTAMYCLVLFYKAFKEELQPIKPIPKFLCVKAVVFLSFWQIVVIAALVKMNLIPQNGTWVFYHNIKEVATGLQDFLICIEMFLAAVAHYFSFSHKPFVDMAATEQLDCCTSFLSMWNVSDLTEDVVEHARFVGHGVQKKILRRFRNRDEYSPLLGNTTEERDTLSENSQANQSLSQAVLSSDDDSQSASENSSRRHYNSFADHSNTASMNNYAEFSVSVEVNEDNVRIRNSATSQSSIRSEDGALGGNNSNDNVIPSASGSKDSLKSDEPQPVKSIDNFSKTAVNEDDMFEHLEQIDKSSDEEEEEILNEEKSKIKNVPYSNQDGTDPVV